MSALPPASPPPARVGSIRAAVHLMDSARGSAGDPTARKRRLVAELCRLLGDELGGGTPARHPARHPTRNSTQVAPEADVPLSPRMRQTLERLLAGDCEKEIAARLGLSRHTVHVYVKSLYRRFEVNSRGELFARFVRRHP
jgi:DNA-binding CsgD family transcriptional regulator